MDIQHPIDLNSLWSSIGTLSDFLEDTLIFFLDIIMISLNDLLSLFYPTFDIYVQKSIDNDFISKTDNIDPFSYTICINMTTRTLASRQINTNDFCTSTSRLPYLYARKRAQRINKHSYLSSSRVHTCRLFFLDFFLQVIVLLLQRESVCVCVCVFHNFSSQTRL